MHLSLASAPSELHSVASGCRILSFPASKMIILVRYKMLVWIKYQLEGDTRVNVPYVCHQAAVSHTSSNMNIGALGRTCMCPNCMQRCTASAIQTTEAFAETRQERTAVENKQCGELLSLPRLSQGCNEIILLIGIISLSRDQPNAK